MMERCTLNGELGPSPYTQRVGLMVSQRSLPPSAAMDSLTAMTSPMTAASETLTVRESCSMSERSRRGGIHVVAYAGATGEMNPVITISDLATIKARMGMLMDAGAGIWRRGGALRKLLAGGFICCMADLS